MQLGHCETTRAPERTTYAQNYSTLADIFNNTARSGEYPEELREEILVPLHNQENHKDHQQTEDPSSCSQS